MKHWILSLLVFGGISGSFAQVSFTIISPSTIAGGYDFTSNGDGTDWGLADLNNPLDAVMDTLALVDDGTPGLNAQGIPLANEGCNPLPAGSLDGKIAVVYRYDGVSSNVCWYGTKVLNAQNAGAVGVIMINREDALIDVPGTTDGPMTSIPFAFISKSDGAILRARMDAGDDVVAFIGNKLGLFGNDIGIVDASTVAPLIAATPALITQNASEFNFDLGTQLYNYGNLDQNNVTLTATVTGPAGTWSQSAGPYSIVAGDSLDVFTGGTNSIPAFSSASYPLGRYTLTYQVDLGIADESAFDNTISYDFVVSDSLMAYCNLDPITNLPVANANYRPANSPLSFEMCMSFRDPNASRIAAEGLYFSAVTGYNSGVSLDGEEVALNLYEWNDVFTDLNDANLAFDNLNAVAYGFYYYPADLQGEVVFGEFTNPVQLVDNQRYMACVQPNNGEIYMGHDTGIDYTRSIDNTLQPISPNNSDNGYFALGFGTDLTPSMALKVFDAAELGLAESEEMIATVFPNPTSENLTIRFTGSVTGTLAIYNILGERIFTAALENASIKQLAIAQLPSGVYTVEVTGSQNVRTQFVKLSK